MKLITLEQGIISRMDHSYSETVLVKVIETLVLVGQLENNFFP